MGDSALPRSNLTLKKGAGSVGRNREHSSYITMCNRVIEKRTGPEGNLRTDGYFSISWPFRQRCIFEGKLDTCRVLEVLVDVFSNLGFQIKKLTGKFWVVSDTMAERTCDYVINWLSSAGVPD